MAKWHRRQDREDGAFIVLDKDIVGFNGFAEKYRIAQDSAFMATAPLYLVAQISTQAGDVTCALHLLTGLCHITHTWTLDTSYY